MTAQPAALDRLRELIAHAVGKALYGWGDDEPNTATGFLVRHDVKAVTEAVMSILQESESASPPPTAAPPDHFVGDDCTETDFGHFDALERAAPERVGEDKESRPVPPMEAGAAISPSTVSDQHTAPERVSGELDGIMLGAIRHRMTLPNVNPEILRSDIQWLLSRLAQPAARSGDE